MKHVTNVACPWDLRNFGGERPQVSLFEARPHGFERAACFPDAHFLSHDLCSAFVVRFVALATYVAWRSR